MPATSCKRCGRMIEPVEFELLGQRKRIIPRCRCEVEEFERQKAAREEEEQRCHHEQIFGADLGSRLERCRFDNFQPRPGTERARAVAETYAETWPHTKGLVIAGTYGNGKTHLAGAIYHTLKVQGVRCVFQTAPELLGRLRATYDDSSRNTEHAILTALTRCELLVMDDLGAERPSDWVRDRLYYIIDTRYRREKPVIYTTNCSMGELEDNLGGRVVDRLIGSCTMVYNKGTSYRKEVEGRSERQERGGKTEGIARPGHYG